jgi:hypothetical protein
LHRRHDHLDDTPTGGGGLEYGGQLIVGRHVFGPRQNSAVERRAGRSAGELFRVPAKPSTISVPSTGASARARLPRPATTTTPHETHWPR